MRVPLVSSLEKSLVSIVIVIFILFNSTNVKSMNYNDSLCNVTRSMVDEGRFSDAIKFFEEHKDIFTNPHLKFYDCSPEELNLFIARSYSALNNNAKAVEYLNTYFSSRMYESKNRALLYKEFINLYDDTSFQNAMTEENDYIERMINFDRYDERQRSKCKFDDIKKYFEMFKSKADTAEEKIENEQEILSCLQYFDYELFDLYKAEIGNSKHKVMLAAALIHSKEAEIRHTIIEDAPTLDLQLYPQQLFQIAYLTAIKEPQKASPLLRLMFETTGPDVYLPAHVMRIDWKNLIMVSVGVSQPYSNEVLREYSRSSNMELRTTAVEMLTMLKSSDALPNLVRLFKDTDKDSIKNYVLQIIVYSCKKDAPVVLDSLKMDYPAFAGIIDSAKTEFAERIKEYISYTPTRPKYRENDSSANNTIEKITHPKMKEIFLDNLVKGRGSDVSYYPDVIANSCTKSDIPKLYQLRNCIFARMSDEGMSDLQTIDQIIVALEWK